MRPFVILLALAASACSSASPPPLDPVHANAFLPAAQFGALQSWSALRDRSLIIEGVGAKFYRATFTAPCAGVPGRQPVTLKISRFGSEDRVQGVIVGAETCYFNTLEPVDDPKSLAIAAPSTPVEAKALPPPSR